MVLLPIKKAILVLEATTATLADCFISLARVAAAIKSLPCTFNKGFRKHCVDIIDKRWDDFDDDIYLVCYFLHPQYKGKNNYIIYIITIFNLFY